MAAVGQATTLSGTKSTSVSTVIADRPDYISSSAGTDSVIFQEDIDGNVEPYSDRHRFKIVESDNVSNSSDLVYINDNLGYCSISDSIISSTSMRHCESDAISASSGSDQTLLSSHSHDHSLLPSPEHVFSNVQSITDSALRSDKEPSRKRAKIIDIESIPSTYDKHNDSVSHGLNLSVSEDASSSHSSNTDKLIDLDSPNDSTEKVLDISGSTCSSNDNSDLEALCSNSESNHDKTSVVTSSDSLDHVDIEDISTANGSDSLDDGALVSRPESLSLPHPLQYYERHKKDMDLSSEDMKSADSSDTSYGSSFKGVYTRSGEMVEFVADNLQEKIKNSRGSSSMGSRTSSMRSISSINSLSSYTSMSTSIATSRSSLLQQSPEEIPPVDPIAVIDLERQAKIVADKVDLMMGNLRSSLHKMSAISAGCLGAYKQSVDCTCDTVDASIKSMYTMMARCEELSITMRPVLQLAEQIKEIKRLLDLFDTQLESKS